MNKMLFTKVVRTVVSIFFILGILFQPATGNVAAQDLPNPYINVRANNDEVQGYEWPLGVNVTLQIGSRSWTKPVLQADWDPNQTNVSFFLSGDYDIKSDDIVTLSDGTTTKSLTVSNLSFTDFDLPNDKVVGIADVDQKVDVWACDSTVCYYRHVIATDGTWEVDFAYEGSQDDEKNTFNIVAGTWVDSEQVDEDGDRTMFGKNVPNPRFDFRANVDQVEGWEWTYGNMVTLAVQRGGNSIYSTPGSVDWAPWDTTQTYISFNLWGVFDIQPGDVVTLSDNTITKEITVTDLAITSFNMDFDTVSGIATPGTRVDVWVCNQSNCIYRHEDADTNKTWLADFSQPGDEEDEVQTIDIARDTWINSQQVDEDGDRTMFGDIYPNYIETHPEWDEVYARGWFRGTKLKMTIKSGSVKVYKASATMDQAPWNPGDPYDVIAIFPMDGFDLQSGQEITISGGGMSKTYLVADPQITYIDTAANTITGIATPGARVQVCAQITDSCISRNTTADGAGNWTVDFSTFSDPSDTPESFDLEPGSNGWMYESDDDGDQTWAYDWRVADVVIDIRPWVDPNPVLCRGVNELIPVAVLSTPEFDATSLDPWSVHFGKTGTEAAVALLGQTDKPMKYVADFNKDGLLDIAYYFRFGDTGFGCSDIPTGQHMVDVDAVLSGMAGSVRVEGADVLRLVRILSH